MRIRIIALALLLTAFSLQAAQTACPLPSRFGGFCPQPLPAMATAQPLNCRIEPAVYQSTYSAGANSTSTAVTSIAVTVPAIPIGDTIIAIGDFQNGGLGTYTYSISDNGTGGGCAYVSAGAPLIGDTSISGGTDFVAFVCKSSVGNPTTVTITQTGAGGAKTFAGMTTNVFSGISPSTIIDGYALNLQNPGPANGATDAGTSGNFTVANSGDLIFSAFYGNTANVGTGFTAALVDGVGANPSNQSTEYILKGAAGTNAATWTATSAQAPTVTVAFALRVPVRGGC